MEKAYCGAYKRIVDVFVKDFLKYNYLFHHRVINPVLRVINLPVKKICYLAFHFD